VGVLPRHRCLLTPPAARARLYALQTLLVAMRMHNEGDPEPALPTKTLELEAVAENPRPTRPPADPGQDERHLMHLQALTVADPGAMKGAR
jgi:hypothetical protein